MQRTGSSGGASQRRPRLLRACATEPSIMTAPIINHSALAVPQPSDSARNSSSPGSYRRATELLSHVAYLSCATSPTQNHSLDRTGRQASHATAATPAAVGVNLGSARSSGSSGVLSSSSPRSPTEDFFGSSPASTNTGGSLDDHQPCSGQYVSFPSFDTWDPDCPEKEEDDEGKPA